MRPRFGGVGSAIVIHARRVPARVIVVAVIVFFNSGAGAVAAHHAKDADTEEGVDRVDAHNSVEKFNHLVLLKFVGSSTIYVSIVPPDFHYASEQIDTLEKV